MEWRACERFGIIPPGINSEWDENEAWAQSLMLGYNSIREQEDRERDNEIVKSLLAPWSKP